MVAPLLAALGAYDCRWPPYASHVAFELWSKPSAGDGGKDEAPRRVLSDEGGGGDAAAAGAAVLAGAGGGAGSGSGAGGPVRGGGEGLGIGGLSLEGVSRGGGGDREARSGREMDEEEEAYVRVTFQGKPVTHRITDCPSDG